VARWRLFTAALAAAALLPAAASAQSGSWSATAGSPAFWDTAGNWFGGTIANGLDNTAIFQSNLTGPYTVALNANVDGNGGRTIGNLIFGTASNANTWTVDQGAAPYFLNLQTSGATPPNIKVVNPAGTGVLNISLQGTQGFTKSGAGNLSMTVNAGNGPLGFAGPVGVSGGTLTLDFSAGASTGTNILPATTDVTLSSGGSFVINAGAGQNVSQGLNSLSVGAGTSIVAGTVPVNRGAATTGTNAVINAGLGALNRNAGGVMVFSAPQLSAAQGILATTSSTNNATNANGGILGGWAIVYLQPINTYTTPITPGGTGEVQTGSSMGWAAVNATGQILPVGSTGVALYTANTFTTTTLDDVTTAGTTTIAAAATSNAVRFNNSNFNGGYTLSFSGAATINTGGILETQAVSPVTPVTLGGAAGTITAGTSSNDVIISTFNLYNTLTVSAGITGAKGLTTGGNGIVVLSGANNYTGATNASGGILLAQSPGALPGFSTPGGVVVNSVGGAAPTSTPVTTNGLGPAPSMSILAVTAGGATGWTSANIDSLLANATFNPGTALGIDIPTANSPFAYNSNIAGIQGLAKTNAGTLTLGGTSTYSGTTTILGGTLSVGTLTNSGSNGPLGSGSTIAFGGLPFTAVGASTPVVSSATLQYTGASTSLNRTINLGLGGGTFNLTNGLTLTGVVSGTGGLTVNSGSLTLAGIGTYLGPTIVTGGATLNVGVNGALPATTDLVVNAGSSAAFSNGITVSIGSLTGGGSVNFGNATSLNIGADTASGVYRGVIANGSGGATTLVKSGAGVQVLTANNTYTGGVTINGGTLQSSPQASAANPLGTGTVTINGPGSGIGISQLAFRQTIPIGALGWNQDGVWNPNEGNANQGVTFPFDGGQTLIAQGTPNQTFVAGGLPTSRAVNPTSSGLNTNVVGTSAPVAGSQLTAGNNYVLQNYNGLNALTLRVQQAGTLTLTQPDSFKTLNVLAAAGNGATSFSALLTFSDTSTDTITGLSALDWFGTAGAGVIGGIGRYNIPTNVYDARTATGFPELYQIPITLSAADQAKTLSSITFTNTVAAGTNNTLNIYALNGVTTSAPSALTPGNNVVVTANSNLEASGYTSVALGTLSANGSTITVTGTAGSTITFTGTTLTGTPTISVPTNVTVALGNVTDANGGFGVTKNGNGTLTITSGSSYSANGTVTVNGGILLVTQPSGLPQATIAGHVSVGANATLDVSLGNPPLWQASDIGNLLTNGTFASWSADGTTVGANLGLDVAPSTTITYNPAITANIGLAKTNTGTLILGSGASTYTGPTQILGGTLSVNTLAVEGAAGGVASGIGAANNRAGALVLSNGGILQYTGGTTSTDHAFTLATGLTSGGGIDVSSASTALTITGAGTGTGPFVKNGLGLLILTGANNWTGGTTINAGILSFSGTGVLPAGAVTDNGTLSLAFTNATTVSSAISGSGGVSQGGPGNVTLSGVNTFTGPISVSNAALIAGAGDSSAFASNASATLNTGGTLSVNGNSVTLGSLAGTAGTVNNTATANATLTVGTNGASTVYNGLIADGGTGTLALVKVGNGTLTLGGNNTYSGGTTINGGTVAVTSGTALGTGPVSVSPFGTLSYAASAVTTNSITLGGGTLAVNSGLTLTINGGSVASGFLGGPGTIATDPTNGARFANVTTRPDLTLNSNSGTDRYINFTNGGNLNVAANINQATPVTFSGFVNQGGGSITVNANTFVNASNFQSYGTLTLAPGTGGNATQLTNNGSSNLFFNGGSRTFLSIPAHAGLFDAGIDLHGSNAVVAGGLFVNNGYVVDSVGAGTKTVIADYGSLVKGAGFYQNSVQTVNGGKFQSGNSPGTSSFGTFTFGTGGVTNYQWQINDPGPSPTFSSAPGIAGGTSSVTGSPDFGWSLIKAIKVGPSPGNFTWTATAASPLTVILQTLTGQTTVGNDVLGPMQNFDPTHAYSWQFVTWAGNYTGPTDAATLNSETIFDQSSGPFANTIPAQATFGWNVKFNSGTSGPGELDLTYSPSPIPEPGTLALTGLAGLGLGWIARRRKARAAA
jgi:autotransporter-associated beta strand protein